MFWHFLDIVFVIFHTSLIFFNLFGWIWRRTRRFNLITLSLTGASWLFLGLIAGTLGYCPLTDWHFSVLESLGRSGLPDSYVKYLADRITGLDLSASLVDNITLFAFLGSLTISVLLNIADRISMKKPYVCPPLFSGSLDNFMRRLIQDPRQTLEPFIKEGMTVLDLGCGPGYFSLEIARMIGKSGKLIAADIQSGMLEKLKRRITGTDLEQRIELVKCTTDSIGVGAKVDFVLAFWMIHEVPDHEQLFSELRNTLNIGGRILIVEPKIHVTGKEFKTMIIRIKEAGFKIADGPKAFFSRSLVLYHNSD